MHYKRPPALPREVVAVKCPDPITPPHDDRGVHVHNPNFSGRLFRVFEGYDALAVRSQRANLNRKTREHSAVERSFRTTGRIANQPAGRWA